MSQPPPPNTATEAPAAAPPHGHLSSRLHELLASDPGAQLPLRNLFTALSGRGHAAMLVVIALPFSLPIPLYGLSTIFGLILAFVGLRIAFARKPWLPDSVLRRLLRRETVVAMARRTEKLENRARRFLRPRSVYLCHHPVLHRFHGLAVVVLSVLLALPLPIPASNFIAALPIVMLGLALLEDDGWFLVAAYVVATLALVAFGVLFWLSGLGVEQLINGE